MKHTCETQKTLEGGLGIVRTANNVTPSVVETADNVNCGFEYGGRRVSAKSLNVISKGDLF